MEKLLGLRAVSRAQAVLLFGRGVLDVKNTALTGEDSESALHNRGRRL